MEKTITVWLLFLAACSSAYQSSEGTMRSWHGTLPCSDCQGIQYTLQLEGENFHEKRIYLGKSQEPFELIGRYKWEGDSLLHLLADHPDSLYMRFLLKEGSLQVLNIHGKEIESNYPEHYRLMPGLDTNRQEQQRPEGFGAEEEGRRFPVDFRARGNEPSWVLGIKNKRSLTFQSLGEEELQYPWDQLVIKEMSQGFSFHSIQRKDSIAGKIIQIPCMDTMSGEEFAFRTEVTRWADAEADPIRLNGCARFLSAFQPHGKWRIEKVLNSSLDNLRNKPYLNLNLMESRLSGFAGCNRMMGAIESDRDSLHFFQMAATKMMCDQMEVEDRLMQALNQNKFAYRIEDSKLILYGKKGSLVLERWNED